VNAKKFFLPVFLAVLLISGLVNVFASSGRELKVKFLFFLPKYELGSIGHVFDYRTTVTAGGDTRYFFKAQPIGLTLSGGNVGFQYFKPGFAFQAKKGRFNGELGFMEVRGSVGRQISTPPASPETTYLNWINIWNANIIPLKNDYEAGGLSPMIFAGSGKFSLFNSWLGWMLIERENISLSLGAETAYFRYGLTRQLAVKAAVVNKTKIFENNILIVSDNYSKALLLGPAADLAAGLDLKKVSLEAEIRTSFLFGKRRDRGRFLDWDNIAVFYSYSQQLITTNLIGTTNISNTEFVFVPMTNLRIGAVLNLSRLVKLGIGWQAKYLKMRVGDDFENPWGVSNGVRNSRGLVLDYADRQIFIQGIALQLIFTFK